MATDLEALWGDDAAPAKPTLDALWDGQPAAAEPAPAEPEFTPEYVPVDFAGTPDVPPRPISSAQQERDERLRSIFEGFRVTTSEGVDQQASVLRLAEKTGMRSDLAKEVFPELDRTYRLGKVDPAMWAEANPELTKLLLERPELASVVIRDKKLSVFSKAYNFIKDRSPDFDDLAGLDPNSDEGVGSQFAKLQEAKRDLAPQKEKLVVDEQALAVQRGEWTDPFETGGIYLPKSMLVPGYRFSEAWRNMKVQRSGYELMLAMQRGDAPMADLIRQQSHDLQLDAFRRDYQEGEVGQALSTMAEASASTAYGLRQAGPLAALAGGVAGLGALAIGKNPGAAGAVSLKVAAMFGKVGAVKGTFELEAGGAYLEMLKAKTEDGRPIPEETARMAAAVYGTLAAGIEFASWGPMFKAMGPVGTLLREGEMRAVTKQLLASDGFRAALRQAGKNWLPAAAAEGGEEALQEATRQAVDFFAKSHAAGQFQSEGVQAVPVIEAGVAGTVGGFGLAGGSVGVHLATGITYGAMKRDEAVARGAQVAHINGLADSPAVRASPEAVAKMIADATQKTGEAVTALHVDPTAFVQLFQSQNGDPDEAIKTLMGDEGPKVLQEALATNTRIAVDLPAYLEKWGPTPAAEALAKSTSTSPTAPTLQDLDTFDEQVEAHAKEIEKEEPQSDGEADFIEATEAQLAAVQGEGKKTARTQMNLWRAFVRTMAEKFGTDANAMFKDLAVQVVEGDQQRTPGRLDQSPRQALQQRAATLDPAARAEEFFRDRNTGLLNDEAFKVLPAPADKPLVGHVSVEGIKYINDNLSHDEADLVYRAVAKALHGIDPTAAKVGGDFALHVKDEAELNAALELVREAMPESLRGLEVTGAVGKDIDDAGKKHGAANAERVKKGERADPRPPHPTLLTEDGEPDVDAPQRPKGLKGELKDLVFPEDRAEAAIPAELIGALGALTPEQYFEAAYRDQKTGEWTARGWAALERKAHVVSIDVKGLRRVNQVYGKQYGDLMLESMGLWAQELGGEGFDFAHLHGDEYAAQADDRDVLEAFVDQLEAVLASNPVMYEEREVLDEKTGQPKLTPLAIGFHHGYGERSLKAADADLNERKSRFKKARAAGLELRRRQSAGSKRDNGTAPRGDQGSPGEPVPGRGPAQGPGDGSAALGPAAAQAEGEVDPLRAQFLELIDNARTNKAGYQAILDYVDGKREYPPGLPWNLWSTAATFGIVDPDGFQGGMVDGHKDLSAKATSKRDPTRRRGGRAGDRKAYRAGVGLNGAARDALEKLQRGEALFYQPESIEEIIAKMDAREAATTARLAELEAQDKQLYEFPDRHGGGPIVVSRDASKPGRWRATWFSAEGEPIGHTEAPDRTTAFRRAIDHGADIGVNETLLEQPPTPEESLENANAQRVFNDFAQEHGATVVPDEEALIAGMRAEAKVHGASVRYSVALQSPEGAVRNLDLDLAGAEKAIRDGTALQVVARRIAEPGSTQDAERHNAKQMDNLGIDVTVDNLGDEVEAAEQLDSNVLPNIDAEEDGDGTLVVVGPDGDVLADAADIPASKDLPGQAQAERDTRGGLGTMLKVWQVVESEPKDGDKKKAPRGYTNLNLSKEAQRLFKIALNKDADLSTFLHESGHVFLKLFSEAAAQEGAPQAVKDDFAAALKWLGADSFTALTVDQHEKWAKGFERYLLEGKAPSQKLEGAFEAFKLWLKGVYEAASQIARLGELNDDIRGVFDRLLATDKEIERARTAMGLGVPHTADLLGMTAEQVAAREADLEKLTDHVRRQAELMALKDKKRETETWWKEELRKERADAEGQYEDLEGRRAQQTLLGKGELWGKGKSGAIVLERAAVLAAVGDSKVKKFKTSKDGVKPDDVADFLGFETGAEMLEAVLLLPDKAEWVKKKALEQMKEKHGDVLENLNSLREVVANGLHGGMTADILIREQTAFFVKAGPGATLTPAAALQAAAREKVAARSIGRLDAGAALAAERKAANEAMRAAARGDFPKALQKKEQQLLSMYMWRELSEAREDREEFLEVASKQSSDKARHRLGKGSPVYLGGTDFILETLGLKEPSPREEPLPSIGEVVQQLDNDAETVGFDATVVERVLTRAIRSPSLGHKHLTVDEMRHVLGALKNIKAAARNKATIVVDGKRMAKEDAIARLIEDAGKNLPPKPPPPTEGAERPMQWLGGAWNALDGEMRKPEFMLMRLGGRDINSPWFRYIVKPLQEAKHLEADLYEKHTPAIIDAFKKMPKARAMELINGSELFPGHTKKAGLPQRRFEILLMLLNAGNAENLERLTLGRGISEEELRKAADTIGITKEEYDWVQAVIDAYEKLGVDTFDLEERDSGLRPRKIQPREFNTPFGKYKGGYFPAVYDMNVTQVGAKQDAAQFMDAGYVRPGTARGHLKARVDGFNDVISLATPVLSRHLAQAIHDLAFRERLKGVANLLLDDDVQQTIRTHLGVGKAKQFTQWLRDVGQMRGNEGDTRVAKLAQFTRWVRGNLSMSVLGYSLQNALEDFSTNLSTALPGSGLKAKYLAAGLGAVKAYDRQAMAAAEAKSGELRARRDSIKRDLMRQVESLTERDFPGRSQFRWYKDHAFSIAQAVDRYSAAALWTAAYRQHHGENAEEENDVKLDADAVLFADAMIRKLMVSHSPVDASGLMRDKGVVGGSMVFFSFFNHAYNRVFDMGDQVLDAKTTKERALKSGAMLGFMLAVFVVGNIIRGQGPDEGDEPEGETDPTKRRLLKARNYTARKLLVGSAELFPIAGTLAQGVESWAVGKKGRTRSNSVVGLLEEVGKGWVTAADEGKAGDERVKAFLRSLGPTTGLPTSQVLRSGGYLWDVYEGEATAEDPLDVGSGLIYGRRQNQPANPMSMVRDLTRN